MSGLHPASPGWGDVPPQQRWDGTRMIRGLIILILLLLVFTFPSTWLLMLFFGNLGMGLSYWAVLPLGILVSSLLGASSSRAALR